MNKNQLLSLLLLCSLGIALYQYNYNGSNADNLESEPTYPTFKQCDPKWGKDPMGKNNKTICQVGCLMSSISEALNGWNITINDQTSNPQILNKWLQQNNGYAGGTSDLIEKSIININPQIHWPSDAMHIHNDLSVDTINDYLRSHRVIIANVLHGKHFVLVVDYQGNNIYNVNDSGFNRNQYSYEDIVGWRIFDMKPSSTLKGNMVEYFLANDNDK